MELKIWRKEIRKHYFSFFAMLICTILVIAGFFMISINNPVLVGILGCLFIFYSIYIWSGFVQNLFFKPKPDVVFLYSKDNLSYFIDEEGKHYLNHLKDLEENKYYYVLRTKDYVYAVLGENSNISNNFIPFTKTNYWRNFCSVLGFFEDCIFLPAVYISLIYIFIGFLLSGSEERIVYLFFILLHGYIIYFDYKYKKKREKLISNILSSYNYASKKKEIDNIDENEELVKYCEKTCKVIVISAINFSYACFGLFSFYLIFASAGSDIFSKVVGCIIIIISIIILLPVLKRFKKDKDENNEEEYNDTKDNDSKKTNNF